MSSFLHLDLTEEEANRLGAKYVKSTGKYRIPNNLYRLRELYKLKPNDEIKNEGIVRKQEYDAILKMKADEDRGGHEKLRPYQRVDVNFLAWQEYAGVFNEMRTGKTPTILTTIEMTAANNGLIICPASVVFQWEDEIKKWTAMKPIPIRGTKKKRLEQIQQYRETEYPLAIISYETLREDIELFQKMKWDVVVCDEAHRLCNYKTATSKAVQKVGRKATRRYALTGTPSMNGAHEIFGILHFLNPKVYSSYWDFIHQYFETKDAYFGGKEIKECKRPEELAYILNSISVQRKQREVMKWLPEKQYQTLQVELTDKQKKHYDEMKLFFQTDELDAPSVLAQLTRLRQLCTAPSMLGFDAESAKEKVLFDILSDLNEPAIVFSNHSSYLKQLVKKVNKAALICGESGAGLRKLIVKRFQEGAIPVLFANIEAAGSGLTLDKGQTVIFLDRHWNPALNAQAEERITPTKEENWHTCSIIDIVAKDTIDEHVTEMLKLKNNSTQIVNNYLHNVHTI
jgi:SNF2 family DNA or RNA helicase